MEIQIFWRFVAISLSDKVVTCTWSCRWSTDKSWQAKSSFVLDHVALDHVALGHIALDHVSTCRLVSRQVVTCTWSCRWSTDKSWQAKSPFVLDHVALDHVALHLHVICTWSRRYCVIVGNETICHCRSSAILRHIIAIVIVLYDIVIVLLPTMWSCHHVIVCVLQCVAAWCSVLQCGAVWCSVVQCVAVCCNVLPCVAPTITWSHYMSCYMTCRLIMLLPTITQHVRWSSAITWSHDISCNMTYRITDDQLVGIAVKSSLAFDHVATAWLSAISRHVVWSSANQAQRENFSKVGLLPNLSCVMSMKLTLENFSIL